MSEKKYHDNQVMNDIFEDTAKNMSEASTVEDAPKEDMEIETGPDGEPIIKVSEYTSERWKELAGVDEPVRSAYRRLSVPIEVRPEPPPFSIPINDLSKTVEVAPGILVSEHLIRDAVAATSELGVEARVEARESAKKKMFEELRQDIDASKRVVQSMIERIKNPPNMKEKFISFDAMPATLQRVVNAYIAASDANRELDEAIKALAAEPRSTT